MLLKASRRWRCVNCDKAIEPGETFEIVSGEIWGQCCLNPKNRVRLILENRRKAENERAAKSS